MDKQLKSIENKLKDIEHLFYGEDEVNDITDSYTQQDFDVKLWGAVLTGVDLKRNGNYRTGVWNISRSKW